MTTVIIKGSDLVRLYACEESKRLFLSRIYDSPLDEGGLDALLRISILKLPCRELLLLLLKEDYIGWVLDWGYQLPWVEQLEAAVADVQVQQDLISLFSTAHWSTQLNILRLLAPHLNKESVWRLANTSEYEHVLRVAESVLVQGDNNA